MSVPVNGIAVIGWLDTLKKTFTAFNKNFRRYMSDILAIIIIIILLSHPGPRLFKYDDSDDKINKKRSGFSVYTDYLTGCQYLSTPLGFLTPRLDKEGKIICIKKGE